MRNKVPAPQVVFEAGPFIRPPGPLREWLKKADRLIRIPVVVCYTDATHLKLKHVFIGIRETDRSDDSIFIELDDTAMGISLQSHLRPGCPPGGTSCSLWIDATPGPVVPRPGQDAKVPVFSIRNYPQGFMGERRAYIAVR